MSLRTRPDIDLTIDELLLRGFPYAGRERVAEAVEEELVRLIEERGVPAAMQTGDVARLSAPVVQLAPAATPDVIGRQIARALYEGLERCRPG